MRHSAVQARWQTTLALALCLVAGYLDGYGLLVLGTYVSFMSGNTTFTSVHLGQTQFGVAIPSAAAIVFFVLGSALGSLIMRSKIQRPHRVTFAVVAFLLAIVSALMAIHSVLATLAVAILSFGTGMVNPVLSKIGTKSVSLTFMTGNLNRIGGHLASALRRDPTVDTEMPNRSHLKLAWIELSVWLSFASGAILASVLFSLLGKGVLIPPLVWMVLSVILD